MNSAAANLREFWKENSSQIADALMAGSGFSFRYADKTHDPKLSNDWTFTDFDEYLPDKTRATWTHPSGLKVTRHARWMPRFGAVEYKVILKNTSAVVLPSISKLHSIDLAFGDPMLRGSCIISSGGGLFDANFPPDSFAITKKHFPYILDEHVSSSSKVDLTTEGGRSSSRDLPFFFVHNESVRAGLFVAFGWSGQWTARTLIDPEANALRIAGKIPGLDIALQPDEEIEGPNILVGLYQGDVSVGWNRLRGVITEFYTPRLAGRQFQPVATYDTWFGGVGVKFDEQLLYRLADTAAELGQEYFLIDAGWTADDVENSTPNGSGWGHGNWYEVNRTRLPNGLKPVADYVRSKGMQVGLWFELERVTRNCALAKQHPDWILWEVERGSSAQEDFLEWWVGNGRGLLDFGRPEVQQWICTLLEYYFREYGVRYLRLDGNTAPLPFWDAHDAADRRGMTQLRYVQGFYTVLDWIRTHHPDVVIENCASGGHRIDLEMARRSHAFWISDYTVDPAIMRFNLSGINCFLPGNYHYVQYTLSSIYQKPFEPDDLGFQSLFGGAFGFGGYINLWTESVKSKAQRHVEVWKQLRRYLVCDYYALTEQPRELAAWSGWQFHDSNDQSGFVQTFRTQTPNSGRQFLLRGLDDSTCYRFTDAYSRKSFEIEGSVAMKEGIAVEQEPMSSQVLIYERCRNERQSQDHFRTEHIASVPFGSGIG